VLRPREEATLTARFDGYETQPQAESSAQQTHETDSESSVAGFAAVAASTCVSRSIFGEENAKRLRGEKEMADEHRLSLITEAVNSRSRHEHTGRCPMFNTYVVVRFN
jgi:hypothetical protein